MALTQISTAGVKDDAVTAGKIPANAVGSSELADNAVDTAAIADNAVTAAKIVGGAINSARLADDAVTSAKIADNAVTADQIAGSAVTTARIADDAVTVAKLANPAVNTAALYDNAVTTAKILDANVTTAKIADNAIGTSQLANNAVYTAAIQDNGVTTGKINDQAVTLAKLEHGTGSNDGKFLRANNGADPTFEEVISVGQAHNLIINGAMQVAQRCTSSTSEGVQTVDRFQFYYAGNDQLAIEQTQSTDAPSDFFTASYMVDITTAESTVNANEYFHCSQRIEAQNLQSIKANQFTLSFWVKAHQTGTYVVSIYQQDGNRLVTGTYTINSSATWEKKTITFPANTGTKPDNNEHLGWEIAWVLAAGSNFTSSNSTSWGSYSDGGYGYGQGVNVASSTDNYWKITGVQLEVGNTATDFAHEDYGTTLAKCKRYYQRSTDSANGTNYSLEASSYHSADGVHSFCKHNHYYDFHVFFECELRTQPTITIYGSSNQGDIHIEQVGVGSSQVDWNNNTTNIQTKGFFLRHIEDSYGTSGSGNGFGIFSYTVEAEL